jgi:hypothetical protein
MHRATAPIRVLLASLLVLCASSALAAGPDRTPLLGGATSNVNPHSLIVPGTGHIVAVDPLTVNCRFTATFDDVPGGDNPGTNFDQPLLSGGVLFAERFVGQELSTIGTFDAVAGIPSGPLTLLTGAPGQNLDVFLYSSNVLAGLGTLGFPDLDAIGEGSIAMLFPTPQARLTIQLVGGNGGDARLSFYRGDGTLIDDVTISGLGEATYGFATSDASASIVGILVQNTDPSGMGIDNVCYGDNTAASRTPTWGHLKSAYR